MIKNSFPLSIKAVMIDLDGTLLDTVADLAIAVNLMLGELGRPPLAEALVRTFVGKGIQHLVKRSLSAEQKGNESAGLLDRALPIYMNCYEGVNGKHATLYPQVREGLDALKSAGFPLACVTNKSERFTLPLLKQMRLIEDFSVVVCGDTLPRRKPDPLPLIYACERLAVAPAEMLMIGDSINDAQAARAAGCPIFCVSYGYNEGADVRGLDVDAIVDTLFDATKLVIKS